MRLRVLALLALLTVVGAACGRSDDSTTTGSTGGTTSTSTATEGLDAGAFGDLGTICSPGDATPISGVTGIDGTDVHLAVFNDAGFVGAPGLNKEFLDTANAYTKWCNEHGGVRGYHLVADNRDVAFAEHLPRVIESCDQDFAMVGGGAAIDSTGQPKRLQCGLPDFAGFVVTPEAAEADLVVQPVPNPIYEQRVLHYRYLEQHFPDALDHIGILAGDFATTKLVADRNQEAIEQLGWTVVHRELYPVAGVDDWKPFVQALQNKGVRGVIWTGEPANLAAVLKAMDDRDYHPDFVVTDANHYDKILLDSGGDAVRNVFILDNFVPFELADESPAISEYMDLINTYEPGGKIANLGAQGLSAWLLFSQALGQCIDTGTVTRDCVYEHAKSVTDWTGGGLHGRQDVSTDAAGDCQIVIEATPDGFTLPDFGANDGPFNCSPDNVVTLTGDYGQGAKCPSGKENPLPSECSG